MRKMTLVLVLIGLFGLANPALADILPIGPWNPTGDSWNQEYNESAPEFTEMEWITLDGATFDAPGWDSFSNAGWQHELIANGTSAVAWGPGTTSIDFVAYFAPNPGQTFATDFIAWNASGAVVDSGHGYYPGSGGNFSWSQLENSYTEPSVPDGGMTLMLLGGALVGLETLRRRFRV